MTRRHSFAQTAGELPASATTRRPTMEAALLAVPPPIGNVSSDRDAESATLLTWPGPHGACAPASDAAADAAAAAPAAWSAADALWEAEKAALVLGAMGVFTLLLQWPLFLVFDRSGLEPFAWPPPSKLRLLLLDAGLDTLYNALLLVGIASTSPLTMSLGSMLVVPASMLADWSLHGIVPSVGSVVGIGLILCGFLLLQAPADLAERCSAGLRRRR
jgi:drug/metabolite transporter (DMT)-like permease